MKRHIPKDEYGMFIDRDDAPKVDSRFAARAFDMDHREVLREIERLTAPDFGFSRDFGQSNFRLVSYRDSPNGERRFYTMTREGFTVLVKDCRGTKAAWYREFYIWRFNRMEKFMSVLKAVRDEFPLLAGTTGLIYDKPGAHPCSIKCGVVNQMILEMNDRKFREIHGIPETEPIRPLLSDDASQLLDMLRTADVGLLLSAPTYEARKMFIDAFNVYMDPY